MILPKNDEYDTDTPKTDVTEYRLPAVMREDKKEISLAKAMVYATILHPLVVFGVWLIIFILSLVGINLTLFQKPKMPSRDIEFVLVDKEGTPINKNTKYRSDRNSRAGGKHDPKRPVSMPQAAAPKGPSEKPKSPAPQKKADVKPQPKQQPPKAVQQPKKQAAPQAPQKTEAPKTSAPKVQAPKVAQAVPKAPVITDKPKSDFKIPVPKSAIPQVVQPSTTAPIKTAGGSGSGISSASGTSNGTGSPSPSFSPSRAGGNGSGAGGGGRFSSGTGSGTGNVGNPGPGNPKGPPGIDAIKEPDFGPYMRELQRRIKMNWDPPKGNESKRVVLLFTISKDGRLLNIKVYKSSGLISADNAAMSAVKLTAPFKPLPAEFRGDKVDIQFTFDYNVFGGSVN